LLALSVAGAAETEALDHHLAQAELFLKRGWRDDAWAEVQAALAAPGGDASFDLHELASSLAWSRRDAEASAWHAHRAAELATDPAAADGARAWAQRLDREFGVLEISAPHEGMATRLQLGGGPMLVDPDDKAYVADLSVNLRGRHALPTRVSIPAGDWTVNGRPVHVDAGGTAALTLPMGAVGRKGMATLQVLRLEAAGGLVVPIAGVKSAMRPSPTVQLGLTLPVGTVLVGALVDWTLQGIRNAANQTSSDGSATGAGLRVGGEIFTASPLAIRPSALLRVQRQPGIATACDGGTCEAAWGNDPHTDVSTAWGLAPGVELAVDYREAGRTTAFGSGVRFGFDAPLGALTAPTSGKDAAGGWAVVTARILGDLSFVF